MKSVFKYQKPVMVSKLIYYNAIYKIETEKSLTEAKPIRNYLNNELKNLKGSLTTTSNFINTIEPTIPLLTISCFKKQIRYKAKSGHVLF